MRRFFVYVRGFVYVRSGGRNRRNIERMDGFDSCPAPARRSRIFSSSLCRPPNISPRRCRCPDPSRRPDPRRQGEPILSTRPRLRVPRHSSRRELSSSKTRSCRSLGGQTAVRCQSDLKSKSAANSLEGNNPQLVVLCGHARFVPRPQRDNRPAIEALVRCLERPPC